MPPDPEHQRPEGVSDRVVEAVGKASEALEWVERARGRVYDLHQMIGRADFLFEDAAELLDETGHHDLAELLRAEVVGRNVLDGRWTYQIVEEFHDVYYCAVVDAEQVLRDRLVAGRRHIYEAELKDRRRSPGRPGHEPMPAGLHDDGERSP